MLLFTVVSTTGAALSILILYNFAFYWQIKEIRITVTLFKAKLYNYIKSSNNLQYILRASYQIRTLVQFAIKHYIIITTIL